MSLSVAAPVHAYCLSPIALDDRNHAWVGTHIHRSSSIHERIDSALSRSCAMTRSVASGGRSDCKTNSNAVGTSLSMPELSDATLDNLSKKSNQRAGVSTVDPCNAAAPDGCAAAGFTNDDCDAK